MFHCLTFSFTLYTTLQTMILPVVQYGCETWSLTLRVEHRLRVFENEVLRRMFGPRNDEVTGAWRRKHNEEFHYLYYLPSPSIRKKLALTLLTSRGRLVSIVRLRTEATECVLFAKYD
jgi:hypothetical protein